MELVVLGEFYTRIIVIETFGNMSLSSDCNELNSMASSGI